jgi:hypothetical protein
MRNSRGLSLAVAAALACASQYVHSATLDSNFADRWVDSGETLEIRIAPELLRDARTRILIGRDDYTGVTQLVAPGVLQIETGLAGLAPGQTVLIVYTESPDGWRELARVPLRVRTRAGFEESEITPRVALTNKSQWNEGRRGQSPPPQRSEYHDLAGTLDLQTRHTRRNAELKSRFRFTGSSVRQEALRFGQQGDDAPKVDLSDYLVGLSLGERAEFEVGHLSVGNHPLLINYFASRGLAANGRLGQRLDYRAAAVAGRQVTGYNDLLGADFDGDTIIMGTVGFAPFEQRPELRMELAWMDAERPSRPGFGIGEVTDSEKSDGVGVMLKGRTAGGRVGGEISWARSSYVNPEDPFLSFGQSLVPVKEETNSAWQASLNAALLRNAPAGENRFANLHLQLSYQRTDPLYRSLGAFVQPDLEQYAAVLAGQLGMYSLQLRYAEQEDNLDRIPTVLKTRTRNTSADFTLPLGSLRANPQTGRSLWPNLSLRAARTHQFAANEPEPISSEFDSPSHLPDQVTMQYGLQANWSLPKGTIGYSLSFSDQDNRQPGRERADFQSLNHGLNFSWMPLPRVALNMGAMRARNAERERSIARYNDSFNTGLSWRILDRTTMNLNWQQGRNHDSLSQAEARNKSLSANLAGNIDLPLGERRVPAQLFLSYSRQTSDSVNRLFGFDNEFGNWSLNSGLSFSF